jgi:hypothetical protein
MKNPIKIKKEEITIDMLVATFWWPSYVRRKQGKNQK